MEQSKRLVLIFVFLMTCLTILAANPGAQKVQSRESGSLTVPIGDGFVKNNLSGYLYIFTTPDSTWGIDDVRKAGNEFQLVKESLPNLGMDHRYHWVRFTVRNTSNQPQSLISHLHFKEVNDLAFYVLDTSNRIRYRQERFDRETPISEKPVFTRNFAFPIQIQPGERLTTYCRVHRKHSTLLIPISLYSKEGFFDYMFTADMLLYFALGIVAVASFLMVILFLFTRRRLLLYYAGYSLFYGLSIANLEGISLRNFNINIPFLDENSNIVFLGAVDFFMILFSINFLQIRSYAPKWLITAATTLVYLSLAFTLYGWLSPFSDLNASLASLLGLLTMLTATLMISYGLMQRKYEAVLYLTAITPLFLVALWFAGSILGLPRTWLFYELSHYSSLFEVVVLGAGIGYKLVWDRDKYLLKLNQLQKDFTSSILQTQDIERQRIAADLHDDLGGTLATIRRSISDLMAESTAPETRKKFETLEPLIQKSSEDLRRISHNLMPPEFDRIGLSNSLAQLIHALPAAPTRFQFLCSGREQRLARDIELNAYRIVSELIQNILKHAKANQAAIQLIYFDSSLRIVVEDNGVGIKNEQSGHRSIGIGLKNCTLRADYIGATLTREISEGGSMIVLDIPYHITGRESDGAA
nr:7TM-DISM domain-containing protein [uncultured Dyadobacter sp.]